jgi:leucine dehydrogenase
MISIDIDNQESDIIINQENFLDYAQDRGFGDLHFKVDPVTKMHAIVAIHSTKLGPALGGCRFIEYPDTFSALYDAMRLARGMSYKAALVNLPLGGGKAVIIKPKGNFDRAGYFKQFGKFVDDLGGRYITAVDSGTSLDDMDIIGQQTKHIASLSEHNGEPSPFTALGVLKGIQAAVYFKLGKSSMEGLHVAIQGLGKVGYHLAEYLHDLGAKLTVADINPAATQKAVNELGATHVSVDEIHKVPCDVFAPCALGAVINDITINQLQTSIVAGAANNQLARAYHGLQLHEKGILYATDYVINAGGLIYAASRYYKTPESEVRDQVVNIYDSLLNIYERSAKDNVPCSEIADTIAQEKLA